MAEKDYQRYISRIPKENRYMLNEKLDFQHGGVEKHLNKIADAFVDWNNNLAVLMGLTRIERDDILTVYANNPTLQRRSALRKWKDKNGLNATYEKILKICLNGENDNCANVIVELLGGSPKKGMADKKDAINWRGLRPNHAINILKKFKDISTDKFEDKDFVTLVKAFSEVCARWGSIARNFLVPKTANQFVTKFTSANSDPLAMIHVLDGWMKRGEHLENLYPCWWSVVYVVADQSGGGDTIVARTIAKKWREYQENPLSSIPQEGDDTDLNDTGYIEDLPHDMLEVAHRWFEVGVLIGVPLRELDKIAATHFDSDEDRLKELIKVWLDLFNDPTYYFTELDMEPTVQILIDAVGHSMGGGDEELAKAMAKKYKKKSDAPSLPSPQPEDTTNTGDVNTQHTEAYYKAIKEKITLMIKVVRLVHAGIPRSGKSTTIKRLVGDILNICSLDVKISPSTGVGKQEGLTIVTRKMSSDMVAIAESSEWSRLKSFMREDSLLKQLLKTHVKPSRKKKNATNKSSQENQSASSGTSRVHKEATREEVHEIMSPPLVDTTKDPAEDKDLEELENFLSNLHMLVINTDTGGHFLDMLCALIMGPSLYLLYHKLSDPLDKPFDIYFTDDKGKDTEKVKSTSTVEESLFQILSSIGCHSKPKDAKEESSIQNDPKYRIRSRALFVGTHLDEVKKSDVELLRKRQDYLKKRVEEMDVYKNGTLLFPKDEPVLAVDNYEGDDKERNDMKDTLTDLIDNNFEEIPIPAAWLILSLYMRKDLQANRTMSLEDCREKAKKLEIEPEELESALWFLHHIMGLILYFPKVKEIENKIFCDVQVIYDSITQLIVHTFTTKSGQHGIKENFREKGMFSYDDLSGAMGSGGSKPDLLRLHELVALLKHLKILAVISDEKGKKTYFMPCVLNNATDDELKSMLKTVEESVEKNPAPLKLQYDCGYVPVGVFPHMIADIASRWELTKDQVIRKNMIQFTVYENEVIFTTCPLNITIALSRDRICETLNEKLCSDIREEVESSLKRVAKCMNYKFDMKYEFGFKCNRPLNDHRPKDPLPKDTLLKDHLCLCKESRKGYHMRCQLDNRNEKLTESQQFWFPKVERLEEDKRKQVLDHAIDSRSQQCKDNPLGASSEAQTGNSGGESSFSIGGIADPPNNTALNFSSSSDSDSSSSSSNTPPAKRMKHSASTRRRQKDKHKKIQEEKKMAASSPMSIEYRTLIFCTPVLVSEISQDTSTVAQALLAKGLIPPNKREADAGFLVEAITNKVKLRTQNYDKFMDILKEQPWLGDLVEILQDRYRELAGGANKGKESKQEQTPSKLAEKHEEQLTEGQTSEQSGLAQYISRIPKENQYMLKKRLDFQHGGVEKHLAKIADAFVDWDINLANLMGLTRIEVSDILSDNNKILQRRKALRKWREKNGLDATYGRILEICLEGNNEDCADVIVKLLGG